MKSYIHIFLLFTFCSTILGQEGAPLLTHFKESREVENQNWAISQDINNIMLFANRKGILTFDGQDWLLTRIPTIPFAMKRNPSNDKIYIGGENSYGFLERDQQGSYEYRKLSADSSDFGIITKIIFKDSLIWFYGETSIMRYNLNSEKEDLLLTPKNDSEPFTGMFVTPYNTFINVLNRGLFRLESDTLFPIVTGYLTENTDILFSLPYDKTSVVLGLSDGNISLFDGIKYYDFKINDEGYLRDNILSEGVTIGDTLYAFSTLDGGALVVDKRSGNVRFTINNQNELPDDEVFALGLDCSGGLWFSHQYGLTRADLNLPLANFSIYPGLRGNLTYSLWYEGELFVATSEGVFYLSEVKNYSEVQVLVKQQQKAGSDQSLPAETIEEHAGSRKNIFSRIFGKRIDKDIKELDTSDKKNPDTTPKAPLYTKKTISKLKSVNYIYKKVDGMNEKCRQLVSTEKGILAATNKGLFVIENHKAVMVSKPCYINFVSWTANNGEYYVAANDGYFTVKFQEEKWISNIPDVGFTSPVYSIALSGDNRLWLGVDNMAYISEKKEGSESYRYKPVGIKNDYPQRYYVTSLNDSIFLFTESGVYNYDNQANSFVESATGGNSVPKSKFIYPLSNMPWIHHDDNWLFKGNVNELIEREMSLLKIFDDVISISGDGNSLSLIDGENRLFLLNLNRKSTLKPDIDVFVKSIYDEKGNSFNLSNIEFNRGDNSFYFDIVAPGYIKQNTTQYQYRIDKLMDTWSPWSVRTNYNLMVPVAGEYKLRVRAKDLWGNMGNPVTIDFIMKPPFTKTTFFYIIVGLALLLIIYTIIRFREKQLHRENEMLEEKVRERTAKIEAQKEEITSSIEYASRIQMAMLPMDDHFRDNFSDYFILFKPRDIVSGDFYWMGESEKKLFLTVADCTGHGVPGAFMSTLGISTLNEIITNTDDLQANTILNLLRDKIKLSLHQTGKEGEAADGMDLAFCSISKDRKSLQYSGAYNPLIVFHGDQLKEYKADRMPIGIYYGEKKSFTNYDINIKKGDTIYLFTDGFSDQFGGSGCSKYKISNLKKLLSEIHKLPMAEQDTLIRKEFERWKGGEEQVDDVTIIGLRI